MFLISFERFGASLFFFFKKIFFALFFVFSFWDSSYVCFEPLDIVFEVFETIYSFSLPLDCVIWLVYFHIYWFFSLSSPICCGAHIINFSFQLFYLLGTGASQVALVVKSLHASAGDAVGSLGWEDPWEECIATHSSSLA